MLHNNTEQQSEYYKLELWHLFMVYLMKLLKDQIINGVE